MSCANSYFVSTDNGDYNIDRKINIRYTTLKLHTKW